MKAIVTGGAGFIGSHLTDRLIELGFDVTVFDDLSTGIQSRINRKARFVQGSVCDLAMLSSVVDQAEYVFHTAALPRIQPSFDDPVGHEEVNVVGTLRCLEALKGSRTLKKLVYSASSSCYGTPEIVPTPETAPVSPLSPYALQKYAAEQYVLLIGQRFDIPTISLRYFNVYGPGSFNPANPFNAYSPVVGIFYHQAATGQPLTVTGDGEQTRDFVHVSDVVEANIAAALSSNRWDVFNVGCGSPISIIGLASLFDRPITLIAERKGEAQVTCADISKIKRALGWKPKIDLRAGLKLLDGFKSASG